MISCDRMLTIPSDDQRATESCRRCNGECVRKALDETRKNEHCLFHRNRFPVEDRSRSSDVDRLRDRRGASRDSSHRFGELSEKSGIFWRVENVEERLVVEGRLGDVESFVGCFFVHERFDVQLRNISNVDE